MKSREWFQARVISAVTMTTEAPFFYHLTQGGRSSGVTQTGRHGIVYGKGGMVPRHKDGTNPLLRKRQRGLAFSVGNMNGFFQP